MSTGVFIVTGFLESGKTTLIKETLMEQEWISSDKTVLILCEEGEEEYSEEYLKEKNMSVVTVDEFEELNLDFFKKIVKDYNPVQVVIEYNGMWKLEELLKLRFPRKWELQGIYSTINGETLDAYLMNMRNMLMEQLTESELIVVNRCAPEVDRSGFRRALKVQNPMAQLIFEDLEGRIIEPTEEDLPYDVKADKICIEDEDFGLWYVDAYENPERYLHKELEFKAQAYRPKGMDDSMFVPVRKIMTCCADDVRFYGYPCRLPKGTKIAMNRWVKVNVRFEFEKPTRFAEEQPVLYLNTMELTQKPEEDIVYIN